MCDLDKSAILEDIRILKDALSQSEPQPSTSSEPSTSEHVIQSSPTAHISESIVHNSMQDISSSTTLPNVTSREDINNIRQLLELNKQLMDYFSKAKEYFTSLLEDCRRKRDNLDHKMSNCVKTVPVRHYSRTIGMPYFKTQDLYYAPLNEDAKLKAARGELEIMHLRQSCRWTTRDRNMLLRAIREEVKAKMNVAEDENTSQYKIIPHSDIVDYIGPLGKMEFDWMKISSTEFQNRHTAEECRVMWNMFLHPDINKTKWTKKEDAELNVLAKSHHCQDWDTIAAKMNSKRTGYQCFIRYMTNNMRGTCKSRMWTKDEDIRLKKVVAKLKIGNFIPWGEVASCMPKRTKQQVYYHWTYYVAPYLKKGRFTNEEDDMLKEAVAKYGTNFSKISAFIMPQRTSAQLSDHYNTILTREMNEKLGKQGGRIWDYNDDIKLLGLYKLYGTNWSRIAKEFDDKTRIQLRHRYAALKRYENRGISLLEIPRAASDDIISDDEHFQEDHLTEIDDVDKELIDYFRSLRQLNHPHSQPQHQSKFFTSQELPRQVRALYNILQALHVNIISKNFVDRDRLTEEDRQLFHILTEFCKKSSLNSNNQMIIERYRLLMFGPSYPSQENEHFVPPFPFHVIKKEPYSTKKTSKYNVSCSTIDYFVPDNNNCQLTIDFSPTNTPENVINLIGGAEQDVQFEKFKELLIKRTRTKIQLHRRIHILSPEVLNQATHRSRLIVRNYYEVDNLNREANELNRTMDKASEDLLKYNWVWKEAPVGIDDDVNFLHTTKSSHRATAQWTYQREKLALIKPNYSILSCYQSILHLIENDKKSVIDVENNARQKVSYRGKIALDLLKRRFEILFTYPMRMAKIAIPIELDKKSTDISIWDDSDNRKLQKKRKERVINEKVMIKKTKVYSNFDNADS